MTSKLHQTPIERGPSQLIVHTVQGAMMVLRKQAITAAAILLESLHLKS